MTGGRRGRELETGVWVIENLEIEMWGEDLDCCWNMMAHAQKPDFVFQRNGRVHLNRRERQFSRLLAAEVCASAVVMLDTPCSEVVWRVLATPSIRQFPFQFPSCAACDITFQLNSTTGKRKEWKNFGLGGGNKDLAGWMRYHYNSCDAKEGGGFP
jgi:hypothetical protein